MRRRYGQYGHLGRPPVEAKHQAGNNMTVHQSAIGECEERYGETTGSHRNHSGKERAYDPALLCLERGWNGGVSGLLSIKLCLRTVHRLPSNRAWNMA